MSILIFQPLEHNSLISQLPNFDGFMFYLCVCVWGWGAIADTRFCRCNSSLLKNYTISGITISILLLFILNTSLKSKHKTVPDIFNHGGGNLMHLHFHTGQHYVALKTYHCPLNGAQKYTNRSGHAKYTEFVTCEKIVQYLLSALKFMCHKDTLIVPENNLSRNSNSN